MKKPKTPTLVTVAITTTVTIVFWVFFTLYQILTSSPPPSVDPKLLEPIVPSLETNKLENVKTRIFFEEGDVVSPFSLEFGEIFQPETDEETGGEEVGENQEEIPDEVEPEEEE